MAPLKHAGALPMTSAAMWLVSFVISESDIFCMSCCHLRRISLNLDIGISVSLSYEFGYVASWDNLDPKFYQ